MWWRERPVSMLLASMLLMALVCAFLLVNVAPAAGHACLALLHSAVATSPFATGRSGCLLTDRAALSYAGTAAVCAWVVVGAGAAVRWKGAPHLPHNSA
jgi:hypothetical protein